MSRFQPEWRSIIPMLQEKGSANEIDRLQYLKSLLTCLAIFLLLSSSGCTTGRSLQDTLAPDPQLNQPDTTIAAPGTTANSLPADFPLYPQAKLQSTAQTQDKGTLTTWTTPDPIEFVYKFYQQELPAKQWEIVTAPSDSEPKLILKQAESIVTIVPQTGTDRQQSGVTTYTINLLGATATATPTPAATATPTPTPASSPSPTTSPLPVTKPTGKLPTTTSEYLTDLTKIGVFTSTESTPNRVVTRREYARWLVAAHNRITGTKPTQQLKLATTDTKPAFQDVPSTNPDFPSIQGLAEAGLISSSLSGDATAVLFRPDAPLTREQMILWKVPLDTRQSLPTASLDAVKQTWGFQDAGKVEPTALRAILADFQNGDRSNIRRVFGYTTLFQPKKTVNLGEVATAIWYFGANSEGLSAREAIGN